MTTTIFTARSVITMNPARPRAEAVAVRGDRVLGVGSVDELLGWSDATPGGEGEGEPIIDDRFADHVLMPGFIEAHTHVMSGGVWQFPYVGFFDRHDPDGKLWPGCKSIDDVVERLIEVESELPSGKVLVAWGLDPIYFPGERMVSTHLDRVSPERPIFVFHASGHLATVNTAMMERSEITAESRTPGVARFPDGTPNGELQEPPAMLLAAEGYREIGMAIRSDEAKWSYATEARNAGHTLITDLGTTAIHQPDQVEAWQRIADRDDYPCRVMIAASTMGGGDPAELAPLTVRLRDARSDKLKFGIVKLILDGSIQGFTARVSWPHYFRPPDGHPGNGLWLIAPDQLASIVRPFHEAGLTVHCHCNGDQAAEVFIDAIEQCLEWYPRADHRHTVQHSQLTTQAQYERMAALGMQANIFSNHIFYWGDQHRDITVGPDRAAGMDACATAARSGVRFSIHSDSPITPMGHLRTAWCAVNRLTSTGEVLGPDERISVDQAMRAITIDAAFQLKLDHEMGTIAPGKYADFAVLDDDPYEVAPEALNDIGVWGTVLGGVPLPADR